MEAMQWACQLPKKNMSIRKGAQELLKEVAEC